MSFLKDINGWTSNLSPEEYREFVSRFSVERKKRRYAYSFCILFGGLGLHRVYLGRYGTALILAAITIFTCGLGAIIALFDLPNIKRFIKDHDEDLALELIKEIKKKEVL
ncbi:TM2 domain-containing protein [Priestia aryabhattai]|uniref:TM2 domain-containing protein n=1 Tax=Priestia aryabhattai TaxID=412384 RepID=UPI003D2E5D2E